MDRGAGFEPEIGNPIRYQITYFSHYIILMTISERCTVNSANTQKTVGSVE